MSEVITKARKAKEAISQFYPTTEMKNKLLVNMGKRLIACTDEIMAANQLDLIQGKREGLPDSLLDRIALNPERIKGMANGLREVSLLPDPVGELLETIHRPNGLLIEKRRVPLGVIGMVYEARPNVTVDAAGLCLKTGNAVILRGGSAAIHSNRTIITIMHKVMEEEGFLTGFLQFIEDSDRSSVLELLKCKEYVDVMIPRGGRSLIQFVVEHSLVPVIETGEGICHLYLHQEANLDQAMAIMLNAKCQRPSVCNAIETLLIDWQFAEAHLQSILDAFSQHGVEVRGCDKVMEKYPEVTPATEEDWSTEYLDYIIAIKIVADMEEALNHIQQHGTKHSEAIITENQEAALKFMQRVDAAAVYHNASTRFTDGFEFGFGAEIGISTQKLHARGPMGLRELTSSKYFIHGSGQIRE